MSVRQSIRDFLSAGGLKAQAGLGTAATAAVAAASALALVSCSPLEQGDSTAHFGQTTIGDSIQVTLLDKAQDLACTADLTAARYSKIVGDLDCRRFSTLDVEEQQNFEQDVRGSQPLPARSDWSMGALTTRYDLPDAGNPRLRSFAVSYDDDSGRLCRTLTVRVRRAKGTPEHVLSGLAGGPETLVSTRRSGKNYAALRSCIDIADAPAPAQANVQRLVERSGDKAAQQRLADRIATHRSRPTLG